MNIEEKVIEYLYKNGMTRTDAEAVVNRAIDSPALSDMKGRWAEEMSAYPPAFHAILRRRVDRVAVAWIDETCPEAWYRPMFADEENEAAELEEA